jgi:hypothetical protein
MYVVVVLNVFAPTGGVTVKGPFDTAAAATSWATSHVLMGHSYHVCQVTAAA